MIQALLILALVVPIKIIHVDGANAIKSVHSTRLVRQAERHFKPQGIRFALKPQIDTNESEPFLSPLLLVWRFYFWNNWARQAGLVESDEIKLFIVPPFVDAGGVFYIGGASAGVCTYKGNLNPVTMAAAEYKNGKGQARWRHSVVAVAHELGHAIGARHTETKSIMHPYILPFVDGIPRMTFAPESRAQIRTCLRGK